MRIQDIKGDLFSSHTALAHCVSSDLQMDKGIALGFRNMFGGINELLSQNTSVGEMCGLIREDGRKDYSKSYRYIYYLITKAKYFQKPTYNNLALCIQKMKNHMIEMNVTELSIPLLGSGLDKLSWDKVKSIIIDIFRDTNITIYVYHL